MDASKLTLQEREKAINILCLIFLFFRCKNVWTSYLSKYYLKKLKLFFFYIIRIKSKIKMLGEPVYLQFNYLGKICLSKNQKFDIRNIYKYDYKKMMTNMKDFCEELVKYVFHPNRLQRLAEKYDMDMADLLEAL